MAEIFLVARGPDGRFFKPICPDCEVPMIHDGECVSSWDDRAVFRCNELIEISPDKPLDACPQTYIEGDPLPNRSQVT
jgi:hypothetical protein